MGGVGRTQGPHKYRGGAGSGRPSDHPRWTGQTRGHGDRQRPRPACTVGIEGAQAGSAPFDEARPTEVCTIPLLNFFGELPRVGEGHFHV